MVIHGAVFFVVKFKCVFWVAINRPEADV